MNEKEGIMYESLEGKHADGAIVQKAL